MIGLAHRKNLLGDFTHIGLGSSVVLCGEIPLDSTCKYREICNSIGNNKILYFIIQDFAKIDPMINPYENWEKSTNLPLIKSFLPSEPSFESIPEDIQDDSIPSNKSTNEPNSAFDENDFNNTAYCLSSPSLKQKKNLLNPLSKYISNTPSYPPSNSMIISPTGQPIPIALPSSMSPPGMRQYYPLSSQNIFPSTGLIPTLPTFAPPLIPFSIPSTNYIEYLQSSNYPPLSEDEDGTPSE